MTANRKDGPRPVSDLLSGLSIDPSLRQKPATPVPAPPSFPPQQADPSFTDEDAKQFQDYVSPEAEAHARAIVEAAHRQRLERQRLAELADESHLMDETPEASTPNAAMKQVLTNQIKSGETWNPLFVNDDWVHFLHDFVEGGLLARISGGALKVLLLIKTWASKETGVALVNQTRVAEILKMSPRQVRRYVAELVEDNYVRQVETDEVHGRGVAYQVIEHLRMFNALPVTPNEQTVVDAAFPYAGKKFREVTTLARDFAKTGNMPPAHNPLELTPLKSPHLTPVIPLPDKPAVSAGTGEEQMVVQQTIHVHVQGDVNAPINIHTAGVVQKKERPASEINLPDGSGNPLKGALKKVKPRQRLGDAPADDSVTDVEPK